MGQTTVQVWYRNPEYYVRECVETGVNRITWDRRLLVSRRIDPVKFLDLYYGANSYEFLICDDMGTQHWISGKREPVAVYPTWVYGDDWALLEELCQYNVGQDESACSDDRIPAGFRPRLGQEHRVVILNPPPATTGIGRKFFKSLSEVQEENPDTIIHVHGVYSYNILFGLNFPSVDVDPRSAAKGHKIYLPTGREQHIDRIDDVLEWVNLLGYKPTDLKVPRNRCMFNIKSAEWAAKFFKQELKFKFKADKTQPPDSEIPESEFRPTSVKHVFFRRVKPQPGDKFVCDMCTLQNSCRYFRTGAVCVVPDSEPQELARFFGTRNADSIIDGLGTLLQTQTHRAQRALQKETEEDTGKLDPELTKVLNGIFDRGVALAKLLDPSLRGTSPVQVNNNHLNVSGASPQALVAGIMQEFSRRGIPAEQVTPDMIEAVLKGATEQAAIETTAREHRSA